MKGAAAQNKGGASVSEKGTNPQTTAKRSFGAYPSKDPVATSVPYNRNKWNTSVDGLTAVILTILCAVTRLYQIGKRATVTWDESHFGKFGAYYINRTFYHDVHPPLAKMIIGFSEYLAGHNGTFRFKGPYPDYVDYVFLRRFDAMFGIALAPLAYVTCHQLNMSRKMCTLASLFVILDNAMCVMSRFVLLDEPLLFFTACSLCSIAAFQNYRHMPFTRSWWFWLLSTGLSLGLVSSSKWVGFLTVALVGLYTIEELFNMYADLMPAYTIAKHFIARAVALIMIPLMVYMACFKIHFIILNRSGPGDSAMSSAFQARLIGSPLNKQPYDVMFGSQVTLRSMSSESGLLHSHSHNYPEGSKQQQITCYRNQDSNNYWVIVKDFENEFNYTADPLVPVKNGDLVRLEHRSTKSMLHAHKAHKAPISNKYYEVTGYGYSSWKDGNNNWRIEIVNEASKTKDNKLHTITTQFRLRHARTGCLLYSSSARLPGWGFKQLEVACKPKDIAGDTKATLWTVEKHINKRVPSKNMRSMVSTGFFSDFVHLNIEMARRNNGLVPNRDKYNHLESDPWSWPFLVYPMRMLGSWKKADIKYYEIGNPLLWWSSTFCCIALPFQMLYYAARKMRGHNDWESGEELHLWNCTKLLWGGWALHYFPFFLMGRVTYIHHYLPALYFALLFLAFQIDNFGRRWFNGRFQSTLAFVWAVTALFVFYWFSPLTFGYSDSIETLKYRKWLPTWNIYKDSNVI